MFRAAVGTIIVLTIFRGRRPTLIKPVFTHRKLILRGLTGMVGTAAYYWTIPAMGAAKATLLCNTYVIFAAIIAAVWLREKIGAAKTFWLVSAFVGIALLTGPNGESGHFSFGWNEAIALVGAVAADPAAGIPDDGPRTPGTEWNRVDPDDCRCVDGCLRATDHERRLSLSHRRGGGISTDAMAGHDCGGRTGVVR